MPSVTTSILVLGPTLVSSSHAIADRSADRFTQGGGHAMGSGACGKPPRFQHKQFLSVEPGTSSNASGTRVVFPAPGAAVSRAFRSSVSVRRRAGSTSSIGSLDMLGSALTRQTVADSRQVRKGIGRMTEYGWTTIQDTIQTADEGEELRRQRRRPVGGDEGRDQLLHDPRFTLQLPQGGIEIAADHHQLIVEIVREAGGEAAERLDLLTFEELVLQASALLTLDLELPHRFRKPLARGSPSTSRQDSGAPRSKALRDPRSPNSNCPRPRILDRSGCEQGARSQQLVDGAIDVRPLPLQMGDLAVDAADRQIELGGCVLCRRGQHVLNLRQGETKLLALQDDGEVGAVATVVDPGRASPARRDQAPVLVKAQGAQRHPELARQVSDGIGAVGCPFTSRCFARDVVFAP